MNHFHCDHTVECLKTKHKEEMNAHIIGFSSFYKNSGCIGTVIQLISYTDLKETSQTGPTQCCCHALVTSSHLWKWLHWEVNTSTVAYLLYFVIFIFHKGCRRFFDRFLFVVVVFCILQFFLFLFRISGKDKTHSVNILFKRNRRYGRKQNHFGQLYHI